MQATKLVTVDASNGIPRFGAKVEHGGTFFFALDMVTGAPKEPDSPLQMPYQTRIRQNPPSERKFIHPAEKL